MVSSTQQSSRIRKRKSTTNGKVNKRERRANGTPPFAVNQDGYDAKAPDAKVEAKAVVTRKKVAKKPKGAPKKPAAKK